VIAIPELHVLPTHEALPGDYRTRDEIRFDVIVNILIEEGHADPSTQAKRLFDSSEAKGFLAQHGEPWDWSFNRGPTE